MILCIAETAPRTKNTNGRHFVRTRYELISCQEEDAEEMDDWRYHMYCTFTTHLPIGTE